MRSFLVQQVLAAGFLAATATAVTPVSDADMTNLLKHDGIGLAMKAQPMFFFGQLEKYPSCIPTTVMSKGQLTPPSDLCEWPDVSCQCVKPGVPVGNPSPSFPVYFSYKKCSETSVRVAYNLFWTKDGAKDKDLPGVSLGHAYDWERAIVVWEKAKDDGQWRPKELLLSQHAGYGRLEWANIHNTFNEEDGGKPRGGADGRTKLDHPKAYTGVGDQLFDNAFRSDDWWYYPQRKNYIRADKSTKVGKFIASFNWGEADSTPPKVADGLCKA
ncbi:hypothetical protein EsDP_00006870 [Epichloe bromicola]|uniref:Uncharacterized protein n=1 Tax=Epichloe bromicola TaxID=79588 RepID=A0ABQ0CYX1_9HYPO